MFWLLLKKSTRRMAAGSADAVTVMFAGAVKFAPAVGLVMATVGDALTVMVTGAEVTIRPEESVACAVSVYWPSTTSFHESVYGLFVTTPRDRSLAKNSTCWMAPTGTAVAARLTFAPAANAAPLAGLVSATDVGALIVIATGAEVVVAPTMSVATATNE